MSKPESGEPMDFDELCGNCGRANIDHFVDGGELSCYAGSRYPMFAPVSAQGSEPSATWCCDGDGNGNHAESCRHSEKNCRLTTSQPEITPSVSTGEVEAPLTFGDFQTQNFERASSAFPPQCLTPEFLAVAIAGEAGELANIVKKVMRGDFTAEQKADDILDEIADVITYCDLFMSVMKAQTSERLEKKWNEVSDRRGWKHLTIADQKKRIAELEGK